MFKKIVDYIKANLFSYLYIALLGLYIWRFFNKEHVYIKYIDNVLKILPWYAWIVAILLIIAVWAMILTFNKIIERNKNGSTLSFLVRNQNDDKTEQSIREACKKLKKIRWYNHIIRICFISVYICVLGIALISGQYGLAIPFALILFLPFKMESLIKKYREEFLDKEELTENVKEIKKDKKKLKGRFKLDRLNAID